MSGQSDVPIVAGDGYDFHQHTADALDRIERAAVSAAGLSCLYRCVRCGRLRDAEVPRVYARLECATCGSMVPHIHVADQARAEVSEA